ncbi:MAG: hypothetical protein M9929_11460 [Burkholderiaceae bacterium]|nr:hypothetical protein [Burkholderiaceae bacterium]
MSLNLPRLTLVARLQFALRFAIRHLALSAVVAAISAFWVFGSLYPEPLRKMQDVGSLFSLVLIVDAVCGPILTLLLASPLKSIRERWVDFSLVGAIQVLALIFGLHSLWVARPVVLAFEVDRLVIVTANEVQIEDLTRAPEGMRQLPWQGLIKVNTRKALNSNEFMQSMEMGMQGISPSMRPSWWLPWSSASEEMKDRARPVLHLLEKHPQDEVALQAAIAKAGIPAQDLRYLPLTSSKAKEWIALLDSELRIVAYANVDGFD